MTTPVIMFMNMKGGVGKTTLSIEISRALAYRYRKHVLLIDYDPQANASFAFLRPDVYFRYLGEGRGVAACLMPDVNPADPFSVVGAASRNQQINEGDYSVNVRRWSGQSGSLWLIPGSLELMRLALNRLDEGSERRLIGRWNNLISSAKQEYDCVVIDCHPAGSFFTKSALLSSDVVVIPVTTDGFAATGLNMMRSFVDDWSSSGGAREFVVVFNNANNSWNAKVEVDIRADARFADRCLSETIRYSTLFSKLASRHQTAIEQPVANRNVVGRIVYSVTSELVQMLQARNIFDASWSRR